MSEFYRNTPRQKALRAKKHAAYRRRLRRRRVKRCICYVLMLLILSAVVSGGLYLYRSLKQMSEISKVKEESLAVTSIGESSDKVEIIKDDWKLILVNETNPVPADYTCEMVELSNGKMVDERCYESLQEMMDDCRAQGYDPLICSAYRSRERQEELFGEVVAHYQSEGYTSDESYNRAKSRVALPGTSEHQLGLAVDIVSIDNQRLDERQAENPTQKWLMKHSWEYGFILRYPKGKTEITGVIYEPWHYRYVGEEAAKIMYEEEICLEEYLDLL